MPSLRPKSRALRGLFLSSPLSAASPRPSQPCRYGSTFGRQRDDGTRQEHLKHTKRAAAPDPSKVSPFKASDILLELVDENAPGVRPFDGARDDPILSNAWKGDGIHKERWRRMGRDARDELKNLGLSEKDVEGDAQPTLSPSSSSSSSNRKGAPYQARQQTEDLPGFEPTRGNGPLRTPSPTTPYQRPSPDLFANIQLVTVTKPDDKPFVPQEMRESWGGRTKRSNIHKRVLEQPKLFHWGVTHVDILSFALRGKASVPERDGHIDFSKLGNLKQVLFLNALPWRYCESDYDVIRWMMTYHWASRSAGERRLKGDPLKAFSLMVPEIINTSGCRGPVAMRRFFHMLLRVPARREVILRNMPILHQNLTTALRTLGRKEAIHNVLSVVCSLQVVLGQPQPKIPEDDKEPEPETDGDFTPQVNLRSVVGVLSTIGFEAAACLGNIPAMRIQLELGDQVGVWKSRQGAYAAAAGLERLRNITAVATGYALPSNSSPILMPAFDRLQALEFLTGVSAAAADHDHDDKAPLATNLRSLAMYYGPVDVRGTPSNRNPIILPGDKSPVDPVRAYAMSLARIGAFRTLYCEWRAHRARIHTDSADGSHRSTADAAVWSESGARRSGIAKHIVDVIRATPTIVRGVGENEAMLADDVGPATTYREAVRLDMKHIKNAEAKPVPTVDKYGSLDEAQLIREEEIYEVERMLLSESWAEGMRGLAIWLRLRSSMSTRVAPEHELMVLSSAQSGYESFI